MHLSEAYPCNVLIPYAVLIARRRASTDHDGPRQSDPCGEILSGVFAPGFRLDEQFLAQRYKVSRTPVREALRQLATTGLIDIRPRRSAIVAQVTQAELEGLFVAMGEMEATCARLAAMSMTPVERRRLQSLHDSMADLMRHGETEAYAAANQSCRNAGRLPRSHAEHDAVVRAILSGDATSAHAAMVHHVHLVEDAVEQFRTHTAA
jgi:DNA-binding GntR family transcriptional regulator